MSYQSIDHWLDHIVINLEIRTILRQSQELLSIFFKTFALFKENNELNEGVTINIQITSDNEVSHVLPKSFRVLVCNTNVDDLVD